MVRSSFLYFLMLCCIVLLNYSCTNKQETVQEDTMVRIAKIEIDSTYRNEYLAILKTESAASIAKEKGVISIFPFYEASKPNEILLLEIYANEKAYKSHLQTAHFKTYKESTLHMVKHLELIDMEMVDSTMLPHIFKKNYSNSIEKNMYKKGCKIAAFFLL